MTTLSIGMIAATIAFTCGIFFFVGYGARYYIYIAAIIASNMFKKNNEQQGKGDDHGSGHNGQSTVPQTERMIVEPMVSIQLPTYNEPNVVERLLTACTTLDYRNYEVILIDDSTDETMSVLHNWAETNSISYTLASDTPEAPAIVTLTLASMQIPIKLIHREKRQGFKGGALNEALKYMNPDAEYVMIFDADFIPPPDIVHRFLAHFPQESPIELAGKIVDLDIRYGKGLIPLRAYIRTRERLARRLRGNSSITEGSRLGMKTLFQLDQLYSEKAIDEFEYTTRSKAVADEMAKIPLAGERYADEPLALRRAFIVGQMFADDKIDAAEYQARMRAIFKPFETRPETAAETGADVQEIFDLDNAYARGEMSEDEYAEKRMTLVAGLVPQASLQGNHAQPPQNGPPTVEDRDHEMSGSSTKNGENEKDETPKPEYVAVQGYQLHSLNQSESFLTAGIRAEYSGSYVVERPCEELFGLMKMISGSVYMIRADVLREYRWGESITEDWELTLRLYADGKRVRYTPTIAAPAECPSTLRRLIRQRERWAEGHAYNAKKYFWKVMRSPHLTWREKAEFAYFVPYYLQALVFIIGTIAWLISEYTRSYLAFWPATLGWALLFSNMFALPLMNLTGLFNEKARKKEIAGAFAIIFLSYIMSFFLAKASLQGLLEKKEKTWIRTYKTGNITGTLKKFKPPQTPAPAAPLVVTRVRRSKTRFQHARLPRGSAAHHRVFSLIVLLLITLILAASLFAGWGVQSASAQSLADNTWSLDKTTGIDLYRIGSLTFNSPEVAAQSGVIDAANGYAYFGTSTSPGKVVKVKLSDLTRVGALSLNSGENNLYAAVIDTVNGYAYFGTSTSPGKVVKVRLSDFTRVGALNLNSGENSLYSGVIDTVNGYAYFGTSTSPGKVVKVRLSDFTRVGALTLNTGENNLYSAVIDTVNGYAYFGTVTSPGIVVKIRLSDFTRVGALTLNSGENSLYSGVIDTVNGYAYFGASTTPGIVVKIRLTDFTRVGSLTLSSGENYPSSAVIDTGNGYAYFGTYTDPGIVVQVRLSDFTRVGALKLNTGESLFDCGGIDTGNGYAYFGGATSPGIAVKVGFGYYMRDLSTPLAGNQNMAGSVGGNSYYWLSDRTGSGRYITSPIPGSSTWTLTLSWASKSSSGFSLSVYVYVSQGQTNDKLIASGTITLPAGTGSGTANVPMTQASAVTPTSTPYDVRLVLTFASGSSSYSANLNTGNGGSNLQYSGTLVPEKLLPLLVLMPLFLLLVSTKGRRTVRGFAKRVLCKVSYVDGIQKASTAIGGSMSQGGGGVTTSIGAGGVSN